MKIYQGSYSIIQYCPFPERKEVLNIGVFLNVPELSFQKFKFVQNISRLEKAFGKLNSSFFDKQMRNLEHELVQSSFYSNSEKYYNDLIMRKSEKIRLTNFEIINVIEPEQELIELFDDLVIDVKIICRNKMVVFHCTK